MIGFKSKDRSIMVQVLLSYLILSMVFVGLLFHKFDLIYHLEKQTYEEIANSIGQNIEYSELNGELEEIMRTFEDEKQVIEKKTIFNFITGCLVTIAISLASLNKIIKNSKSLWKEFNHYKERIQEDEEKEPDRKEYLHEKEMCFKIDETTYTCTEIKEIIQQIHECKEDKAELKHEETMIEEMTLMLIDQFIQILSQTTYYTHQIYHDKEQLATAVDEIKKGITQISQIRSLQENIETGYKDEEMVVAVHQMNSGIEEMNELLMQLEKKIKGLERNIQKYHPPK
ncbi:hypothetical protein QBE52_05850 [Clostridiaceae bacterium 35-E11]